MVTTTNDDEGQDPICRLCGKPCGKGIGAQTETINTFWGGSNHGSKVFYTDRRTYFFCSEVHRTEFFYGDSRHDGSVPGPAEVLSD